MLNIGEEFYIILFINIYNLQNSGRKKHVVMTNFITLINEHHHSRNINKLQY